MTEIMDMAEAARRLKKGRRWLQAWLRDHPADATGKPYYSPPWPHQNLRRY